MDLIQSSIVNLNDVRNELYKPQYENPLTLDYDDFYDDSYNETRRSKIILFNDIIFKIFKDTIDFNAIENICTLSRIKRLKQILYNVFDKSFINIIMDYYSNIHIIYNAAKKIEVGCLNQSIKKSNEFNIRPVWEDDKFNLLYHGVCYKIATNLDENSSINSDYMKKKILSNSVNLYKIACMTSKQLCPSKNISIENKINKRINVIINLKYSELYRCKKCKRNQTTTERRYNRSLDEGVNLTITCTFCGHQWNG